MDLNPRSIPPVTIDFSETRLDGLRTARLATSPLKCLVLSRASLQKTLEDGDPAKHLDCSGVYLLLGPPDAEIPALLTKPQTYIGQADAVDMRLEQHLNNHEKDWFNFVFVLRLDEVRPFNISQIKEIESTLCKRADVAKVCNLRNKNTPQGALLASADQQAVDTFVDHAIIMFTALNLDFFSDPTLAIPRAKSTLSSLTKREPVPSPAMKPLIDELRAIFTDAAFPGAKWYSTFTPDYRVKVVDHGEERTFINIRLAKDWLRVACRGTSAYKEHFKIATSADVAAHHHDFEQAYHDAREHLEIV